MPNLFRPTNAEKAQAIAIYHSSTDIHIQDGWVYSAEFDAETDSDGKPWDD